ncbi:acyl-CoA dehydrogenase family protein [Nonomuraea sp. NPDC048826]|uniref:acyl-CoA dehydrogenase family protein n=1 Tax=Nonomuraea sp. NPDC048826 TaxID=3364347 RepID=UPI003724933A
MTTGDREWRQRVRSFAEDRLRPLAAEMDTRERLDPDLVKALFEEGLMGVEIPERYGGAGRDLADAAATIEELARVDPAVAVFVDVQNVLVSGAVLRYGTGDQRRRHLPRLASGTVGAFALSEEEAGSDAFAMAATATPADGGGFVLTGRKKWITNAAEAGLILVIAKVRDGDATPRPTAFLVEPPADGLTIGPRVSKMGIRATSTCEVILDGVRVGPDAVLGAVGEGDMLAIETLALGKIGIAAQLVGLAGGALEGAIGYAQRRRQFGEPIAAFQGVQFALAEMATEVAAASALLGDAVRAVTGGASAAERLRACSMAKLFASDVAERVASRSLELHGGNGFSTAYPAERFYRDVKVGKIYEGTSHMQLRGIASILLGAQEVRR